MGDDHTTVRDITGSQAVAVGPGATAIYQGLTVAEVSQLFVEWKNADQPTVWDGRVPYMGLGAFHESDARFFFGRERDVQDLLMRVEVSQFITIAGPSGSGKSSVARAGLLHALRHGQLPKSDQWLLATMLPGDQPLENLAIAIERLTKVTGSADNLRRDGLKSPQALHQQTEILLTDDPSQRLVLLVDQFEEVFTQTKNGAEQAAFIQLLTHSAQTEGSRLTIILSLRDDFISHCARYPDLRELMNKQLLLVGAMEAHDLAKAITLPALEVGAEIDAALVSRIMADMKGEPGALPLMSFALQDLFEAEKSAVGKPLSLTLPEYLNRGGIEQALERHANEVFADFTAEQKGLAREVFSKLITVGQGRGRFIDTRKTAVFSELIPAGQDPHTVRAVVDQLAKARLLTTSGDKEQTSDTATTVTIAHETLIDAWPWLRRLVDENRESIALQNQISHDAQIWTETQDAGYLYRGGRLLQVEDQLLELRPSLNNLSQQFIQVSLDERQREIGTKRKVQFFSIAATLVIVALVIATIINNIARGISDANADFANAESTRAVAAQATSAFNADLASTREAEAKIAEAEARVAEATSEANAALAITREAEAVNAQSTAQVSEAEARAAEAELQQLKNTIQASQLALLAQAESANNPERSLLLAVAGLHLNVQSDTQYQLSESLQSLYRTTLYGHEDIVWSAIFSPDGQTILTASFDRTARLWDGMGNELAVLRGHEDWVRSAVFSPDGQMILTASENGTVRLWNLEGNELAELRGHEDSVYSAVFSPNGQKIVTASTDGTARLWDTMGNELAVLREHEDVIYSAVFNPDGQRIVTASSDDTARLWDEAGNELAVLRGHDDQVSSAVFSPDGQKIVTASFDGTARLWNEAGNELAVLRGHEAEVIFAVFHPDGQMILTASDDDTARLWDGTGNELAVLRGHGDQVTSALFSPDGERIVTTSYDNTTRLWDLEGIELAVLRGHEHRVNSAVFSPDGQRLVTASWDGIPRLWDLEGIELAVLRGHEHGVTSAIFSPDGQKIVTASFDLTARLWDLAGNELAELRGHTFMVKSAVFSPDGQKIVTASQDRTARLWDLTGNELIVLRGHAFPAWDVNSAIYSPDGQKILTAGNDRTARLWDGEGIELAVLQHGDVVNSAVFSPNGQKIVTASNDGTARLWDEVGNLHTVLRGHTSGVNSAVFSHDGKTVLTTSYGTAQLWDEAGNELTLLSGHEDWVKSAVFSPDGQTILTASQDHTARLWDLAGNELAVLSQHEHMVWSAVFSPDGQTIVTASGDGTARLWDLAGNELAVLRHEEGSFSSSVFSAVFSPDGQTILTASGDGTARLWPNHSVEYIVSEGFWRIKRGFTEAECLQYFRDDLSACPRTKKQLFAPLVEYFSPEQQEEWTSLPSS